MPRYTQSLNRDQFIDKLTSILVNNASFFHMTPAQITTDLESILTSPIHFIDDKTKDITSKVDDVDLENVYLLSDLNVYSEEFNNGVSPLLNKHNIVFDNHVFTKTNLDLHISFTILMVGGDWQNPTVIFLYVDDKNKARAYVPKFGNSFDPKTKELYDNEIVNYKLDFDSMLDSFLKRVTIK